MSCVAVHPITPTSDADVLKRWRRWLENAPAVTTSGGGGGGRVLLISYIFPPTGGSGAQRPAKLAKYLPQCGWTVEVLCAGHDRFPWHDATLMADVPAGCRVHRIAGYEPACIARRLTGPFRALSRRRPRPADQSRQSAGEDFGWLEDRIYWRLAKRTARRGLGNGESLWINPAIRAALRLHRRNPFHTVVSSGPPVFVHRVAMGIARETGLPWLADVRDPFVSDHARRPEDNPDLEEMAALERNVLQNATGVITTCRSLAADLGRRYPEAAVRAIINGFDRDDILKAEGAVAAVSHEPETCTLAATGSFYGQRELSRLVRVLERLLDQHPEWQGRVRLVVAGTLDARQQSLWETDRPEWLRLAGYLDHRATINLIRSSACSVLVAPDCNHTRLCLPGKMFELMALPTHILALVPRGSETEQLLLKAGACTTAPYEDEERSTTALEQVIGDHFEGRLTRRRDWPVLEPFDRRAIAAAWADCLNAVRP